MSLASFFTWFLMPGASDYIQDRIDAEKPLAAYHVQNQNCYIAKHAESRLGERCCPIIALTGTGL
jgi:hypothetical protein